MDLEGLQAGWDALDPEDSAVGAAFQKNQLSEIFIQSNQDALFCCGQGENFFIAGIGRPIACPNQIMTQMLGCPVKPETSLCCVQNGSPARREE